MEQTEAFRLLASADRQLLLHELRDADGTVAVEELSERIAARRHRIPLGKIDDEKIDRAYVRLIHTHLPQLAEKDVISYDRGDKTVRLRDEEPVDLLFEAAAEIEAWPPDDLLEHPSRRDY